MPTGSEIRQTFIRYFVEHGHRHVHSSSLVPASDPTLLFTNAGMNQFKDVFLGLEKRDYNRATTSQKCVRAGGKHNDLENVGFTKRHHTFFEMLGNFSFGDYFKQDAIRFAWELVTSQNWYGIDPAKLYCTIFKGEQGVPRDDEAYNFWREVGVPEDRIFELGMKDNFWQMGDTGPCGPCSEIHYDMGPAASDEGHGVSSPECKFPCDCGRYVEIWNLVFMQFDRDAEGKLTPLPKPCVDTGMGLERTSAVLQGVLSNYDTDFFRALIDRAAQLTGVDEKKELEQEDKTHSGAASLRVIADHARATTFLISDGVVPSNEGRGYVLRKIMRRAIRHGRLLGYDKPFLYQMVYAVRDLMKDAYPELVESADRVAEMVKGEETRFAHTLNIGLHKWDELVDFERKKWVLDELNKFLQAKQRASDPAKVARYAQMFTDEMAFGRGAIHSADEHAELRDSLFGDGAIETAFEVNLAANRMVIRGEGTFKLYDTFGLQRDFMLDLARDQAIVFDQEGFDRAMAEQRSRAQASWKGGAGKATASPAYRELAKTVFEGYRQTKSTDCEVIAIIKAAGEGARATKTAGESPASTQSSPSTQASLSTQSVPELKAGQEGEIVLDHTPFYAESGGQVGDVGWFYDKSGLNVLADVKGCFAPVQGVRAHRVIARQNIVVGDRVDAVVDAYVRSQTMRNHTGTHLLHAALRQVLGTHVKQAGSLVDPRHLRFDFSHFAQIEDEQMQDIEDLANQEILRNDKVQVIEDVPIDVAINEYKAMALFGEKYGERVRVIKIGDFSTELCGGTHTAATGEIGLLKVLHEGSVSAGVRRVEAVTGEGSLHHFRADHQLENVARNFVRPGEQHGSIAVALQREIESRDDEIRRLKKELDQARMKSAASSVQSIDKNVREVKGVKVLAHRSDNLDRPQMRTLVDNLRNKLGSGVVVLGSATDGKVALIVGVTKDLTSKVQAGKIVGAVARKVGGKGGGRPDLAEAGGTDAGALDSALDAAYEVVGSLLGQEQP